MKRFLPAILTSILFAASVSLLSGCATVKKEKTEATAQACNAQVAEKLLLTFLKNESDTFIKMLPGDAAETVTENDFKKTREAMIKQFGKPVSYCFVTNLEHPLANISIWRIRFERKSSDGKKTITQEVLFKVLSTKNTPETLAGWSFL